MIPANRDSKDRMKCCWFYACYIVEKLTVSRESVVFNPNTNHIPVEFFMFYQSHELWGISKEDA